MQVVARPKFVCRWEINRRLRGPILFRHSSAAGLDTHYNIPPASAVEGWIVSLCQLTSILSSFFTRFCGCLSRIEKSIPDVGVKITLYSIRSQSMVLMGRGVS